MSKFINFTPSKGFQKRPPFSPSKKFHKALLLHPSKSFHKATVLPPTDEKKPSKQVQDIVQCLELRLTGQHPNSPNKIFPLTPKDFDHLLKTLELDRSLWGYFQDKVRYDYSSRAEQFILRMPSPPHELCLSSLITEILKQLSQYHTVENSTIREFSTEIEFSGSIDLKLLDDDGNINKHTPDASFLHSQAEWPGIVVEVASSQSLKKLGHVAQDYIYGSDGGIQVVIGLDLDYKGKGSRVYVWRVQITTREDGIKEFACVRTVAQEIVDSDGNLSAMDVDQGLGIQLRDFAAIKSVLSDSTAFSNDINISYKRLGEMVLRARENAKQLATHVREKPVLEPSTVKLRRARTPEEELLSDDEAKWKAREDWEEGRLGRGEIGRKRF